MINKLDDPAYVARLEKAIADKYGENTIQNPKKHWNDFKEQAYLEELKRISQTEDKLEQAKVEINGIFIPKHLLIKDEKRICVICDRYSFNLKDDVYINKFDCCYKCYVQWVENREERWKNGWRPKKELNNG